MKKNFFIPLLLLAACIASAQKSKLVTPAAWGHYKKLTTYSAKPTKGMESFDTLIYVLPPGDTRVTYIKRPVSNPSATNVIYGIASVPAQRQPLTTFLAFGRRKQTYYLTNDEEFAIDDPPANSSPQTRAELDYLLQLQSQRTEEDVESSIYYAGVFFNTDLTPESHDWARNQRILFFIGRSIGTWFNADSLPLTAKLVANAWHDASYYLWMYKNYFVRIRPCKLDTKIKNLEETNWAAYPSGHATNSYVNAYLYSALIPEFSSFFIKDAYDLAHSREILGVHYPSDSESGRLLAYQLVQRLLTKESFKKDFAAAKEEIRKVKATKGF